MRVLEVTAAYEGGVRRHLRDTSSAVVWRRERGRLYAELREVATDGADGLLVHAHSSVAGGVARLAGWVVGVPCVYTPHAFSFYMRSPFKWLYWILERLLVPFTARIIVVSEMERESARALGYAEDRIALIPNALPDGGSVVRRGPSDGSYCFIGRLAKQKGVEILPRLAQALPDNALHIYGDGPLRKRIERAVEGLPNMTMHGWVDGAGVEAAMLRHGALVMPSRWEGCPYTILEAWRCGLPVVASGECGLVTDGIDGFVVGSRDIDAWAAKVRAALGADMHVPPSHHTFDMMVQETQRVYRAAGARKPSLIRALFILLAFAALIGGAVFVFFHNPEEWSGYPRCPLFTFTGHRCLTCGATRALYHLLHLHPLEALRCNALVTLLPPLLLVGYIVYPILRKWCLRVFRRGTPQ